jgi:hypothetical protein
MEFAIVSGMAIALTDAALDSQSGRASAKMNPVPASGIPVWCVARELALNLGRSPDAVRVPWRPRKLDQDENR